MRIISQKCEDNIDKVNAKFDQKKNKTKNRFFSLYKIYDYDKKDYITMMHVFKRELTPVRENYPSMK